MADVILPTWIIPEEETQEWIDDASAVFRSAFAPGLTQRQGYGGLRLKLKRRHTVRGEEKAQLLSVLQATRGQYNTMRTKVHFARRGTGFGNELLSNNTFASDLTNWAASSADISLSEQERILRVTRKRNSPAETLNNTSALSLTSGRPYIARAFIEAGRGPISGDVRLGSSAGASTYGSTSFTAAGMQKHMIVASTTSAFFSVADQSTDGLVSDYWSMRYASAAGCALVDNGVNVLTFSDQIDNAAWTKGNVTVSANQYTSPDGTGTGDQLIETTATGAHTVEQSFTKAATAMDVFVYGFFRSGFLASPRTRFRLEMYQNAGADSAVAIFDTSNGTIVSGPTAAGSVTNARAGIQAAGNGWYFCWVGGVATANTTVTLVVRMVQSGTTVSYTGQVTSDLGVWRLGAADSPAFTGRTNVIGRAAQSTASIAAGTTGQTGSALYLKGLVASTTGLLLPGDWIEVGGELKHVTAPLDSDEAGLGYLQFEPALVRSPADTDPVIITDPMGKFLVSNIKVDNRFGTDAVVTYDLEHVYE